MPKRRTDRAAQARKKRREELLKAATRVFAKRGYRAASISDIIASAGVARGTFYPYFRSKQDILLAVIDDLREQQKVFIAQLSEQERGATHANPREQARQGFLAWLRFYDQRRDALKILLREANLIDASLEQKRAEVRRGVVAYLSKRIRRRQNAGLFQREISPEIASHCLIGMLDEITLTYLQKASRPNLERLAEQCVSFELDGLLRRR
jgi:TetR/AcrR family transcriptional regulator, fatty acid metabolism regulator protein